MLSVALSPLLQRLIKSSWLILTVAPYEQVGTGPGVIFVAGDSTAYGTGASKAAYSVAGQLGAAFPEYTVTTDAVNGRLIAELIPVLTKRAEEPVVDLLLIQIGGNDVLRSRPIAAIEADIRAVLALAKTQARHVVFMSTGNIGAAPYFATTGVPDQTLEAQTRAARAVYQQVSAELGVDYVDLFIEPADDPFLQEAGVYMASDGLHPSDAGYAAWFKSLLPVVMPYLRPN